MAIVLDYLTDNPAMQDLADRYWEQDADGRFVVPVSDLADVYGINASRVSQVLRGHCIARCTDSSCPRCGLGRRLSSRTDYEQGGRWRYRSTCDACQARDQEQAALAETKRRRDLRLWLVEQFPPTGVPRPVVANWSLPTAVAVLALIRVGATEDFSTIQPDRGWRERLSPRIEFDRDVLVQLWEEGVLARHPDSPVEAFEWEGDNTPTRWYPRSVHWTVVGATDPQDLQAIAIELERIFRHGDWPESWWDQLPEFARTLAIHDALDYLETRLSAHGLPFRGGEKTHLTLERILEDFTLGQVYSFIWRAVEGAAAFYMRSANVTRPHAANSVVGRLERSAERAITGKWNVNSYGRIWDCPESAMLSVLFRVGLQVEPMTERLPATVRALAS